MKRTRLLAALLALCLMIPCAPMALSEEIVSDAVDGVVEETTLDLEGETGLSLAEDGQADEGWIIEEELPEEEIMETELVDDAPVEEVAELQAMGDVCVADAADSEENAAAENSIVNAAIADIADYTYTGSAITPDISVTFNGKTLVKDTDYTLSYTNNTNAGTATIAITGIGNYTGTTTKTFGIKKAERTTRVSYIGPKPTKVYDKTKNVTSTWKVSNFTFSNVAEGDKLKISTRLSAAYDKQSAGDRKVTVKVSLVQTSDNYEYTLENPTFTVDGVITPKTLTITPTAGQSKVYGAANPSNYKGKVSGLMSKDTITGKLSREEGEDVGKYKITIGTIMVKGEYDEEDEYSYEVDLKEEVFEIKAKSINATDVSLAAIKSLKHTGNTIEPNVTLQYDTQTLTKGKDYEVKFFDISQSGTVIVTITGKGNYTGSREASFRIQKIDSKCVINVGTTNKIDLGNISIKSFKSTKKSVATVNKKGVVTAKKAGKTKIVITFNKKTKLSIAVTVLDPTLPTKIALDKTGTVTLDKRETLKLGYTLAPDTAQSGVKWKSSNKKVATVVNGVVTPKKTGKVTITATTARGKKKAKVKVRIVDMHAPGSVSIQQGKGATIKVGETLQLSAALTASHAGYEPMTNLKWISSNKKVATVNKSTGAVTAKKPGTAKITVKTSNKKKAVITIKVVK